MNITNNNTESISTGDFVNPGAFRLHRCYYCRTRKPDAVKDRDGDVIYRLMYGRITPLTIYGKTDLHQIWLCRDCVEWNGTQTD